MGAEGGILAALKRRFRKKKVPRFYRGQVRFRERYPGFEIGVGTYGMPEVHDWAQGTTLSIGAYASIADDVHVFLGGNHRTDWVSTYPFPAYLEEARDVGGHVTTRGSVRIGNDVWLGSGCLILSGVTIGDGAVVAARAVVTRDIAPYAIVAGNPARIIGWRFDEPTRIAMQATAWWTWPETEIRQIVHLLCSAEVGRFLDYARNRTPDDPPGGLERTRQSGG